MSCERKHNEFRKQLACLKWHSRNRAAQNIFHACCQTRTWMGHAAQHSLSYYRRRAPPPPVLPAVYTVLIRIAPFMWSLWGGKKKTYTHAKSRTRIQTYSTTRNPKQFAHIVLTIPFFTKYSHQIEHTVPKGLSPIIQFIAIAFSLRLFSYIYM